MPNPGGSSGFGAGGQTNAYPSRTYIEWGTHDGENQAFPDAFVGGARGPAAIPSRVIQGGAPAPSSWPRIKGGDNGPISYHRGAFVEDAGAPRLNYDNELGHNLLPWSRPFYPNIQGLITYRPPTTFHRGAANGLEWTAQPSDPIPVQKKRIANFMVRRPFGNSSTGNLFPGVSLAQYVADVQRGWGVQGKRWTKQAKTKNPTLYNRSQYGTAGSYGQTTSTLATAPTNSPGGAGNGMGAY